MCAGKVNCMPWSRADESIRRVLLFSALMRWISVWRRAMPPVHSVELSVGDWHWLLVAVTGSICAKVSPVCINVILNASPPTTVVIQRVVSV